MSPDPKTDPGRLGENEFSWPSVKAPEGPQQGVGPHPQWPPDRSLPGEL